MYTVVFIIVLLFIFLIKNTIIVVSGREKVIKENFGKFVGILDSGFHIMIPIVHNAAYRHDMREQVIDVPVQTCITKDNVQVAVDGVIYLQIMDAKKASYGIENYVVASINMAQTTMRAEIGKLDLDSTFSERDKLNTNIVREVDKASDPWGIKVKRYEIQNISPARKIIETLEKQMEAERSKRAQITLSTGKREALINKSEGERQEAINMSEGAKLKRINESKGRAAEISLVADATAYSISRVSGAIAKPGGGLAVKTQLLEQYIEELGKILGTADISILPADIAKVKSYFEGLGNVTDQMKTDGGAK